MRRFKNFIVVQEFNNSDRAAFRKSNAPKIKHKKEVVSKCQKLNEWVRVDDLLFRWRELYWYLDLNDNILAYELSISELINPILDKIGEEKLSFFAKRVHEFINRDSSAKLYWYSYHHHISLSETRKIAESTIDEYFGITAAA